MNQNKVTLSSNPFEEFNVEYIWQPYWTFLDAPTGKIDFEYFEQYKNRLVIINFASEHWNDYDETVCKHLEKTNINFLILTHDPDKHQRRPRMFYFPHWYYKTKFYWKPGEATMNPVKNYSIGCLNGNCRPHRIANFLKLQKSPYWDKVCITFYNTTNDRSDDFLLTDNETTEWNQLKSTLKTKPRIVSPTSKVDINQPQLSDAYLHLVTETTILNSIFLSEKIWRPIVAGVPFVVWGNPNTVKFLRSVGVDVYDDVIDHNYYDLEEDPRTRFNKLHEVIDNLIDYGVDKIYNQLLPRAIKNQEKFFQGVFGQVYYDTIVDAITQYK